jgi:hypothetical protein
LICVKRPARLRLAALRAPRLTEINVSGPQAGEAAFQEIAQGPGAGIAGPGSGQTASPHLGRLSIVTSRSFFACSIRSA